MLINMIDIKDETFKQERLSEAETIMSRAEKNCQQVLKILEEV